MNQDELIELYCAIDDFWKVFKDEWDKHLIDCGKTKHGPESTLSIPEMLAIIILFHQSHYRNFKHFYNSYVKFVLKHEFPKLISYGRFVSQMHKLFIPLFAFIQHNRGELTGISFIDSTKMQVCHNKRIKRNKVFSGLAARGKTFTGWFYGFKMHLIINEIGEILAFQLTSGNISDVSIVETMSQGIIGKMFGDKGYISSKLAEKLFDRGLQLFTTFRKNMKNKFINLRDKVLLRKRVLIETVNDQLKNISQLEHSRHRSPQNFLVNALAALMAYIRQPKKPHMKMNEEERNLLLLSA
jgi:hypothetical protein